VEPVAVPELAADSDGPEFVLSEMQERSDSDPVENAEGATVSARESAARVEQPSVAGPPLESLLGRFTLTRLPDGGLRLEAPPEAADELHQLLRQLAGLFAPPSNPAGGEP
jgi:hypothetical protein